MFRLPFAAAFFAGCVAAVLGFSPAAAMTPSAPPPFDAAAKASELERIGALVADHYVYADKAAAIAAEVRGLKSAPDLAGAADRSTWAAALTRRLTPHDAHFAVTWKPPAAAAEVGRPASGEHAGPDLVEAATNYGFDAVQRLPGNIAYVRLSYFAGFDRSLTGAEAPAARRTAEAALALIATTDAVIFDLRDNGGGSPDMIDLLLTPFFGDKPVLLNRFYQREGDRTIDFTTFANFEGARRPSTPIYVLTSGRTASAAEEFSYDVQTQKRGIVVGETTYGGANPGDFFDAGDGFSVFISTGAAVNPITGRNWDGVGVKPDIPVPAADALTRTQTLALTEVLKNNESSAPTEARWTLERLTAIEGGARVAHPADYVGDFAGRVVTLDGGQLAYHRERFPTQRLIALGGDAFALEATPGVRLSFERDGAGKVAALLIAGVDGSAARYPKSVKAAEGR
jgi:hypothetical protein